jgi:cob(I)alamin adenosyltransferase
MKIYTQTGDHGKTSLLSGERVSKSHIRIKAYGSVDELNASLGVLHSMLPDGSDPMLPPLKEIQSDLFHIGALLAATPGSDVVARLTPVGPDRTGRLEHLIDHMQASLPELKAFILPGGHPAAAWAHVARTVCRRAERDVIELAAAPESMGADPENLTPVITYLNRLSDYLFVAARFLNHRNGRADVIWRA